MKKVITYGTFDLFHEGHLRLLERAKALGDYLIVGVTTEAYDRERGKLNVVDSLMTRIENVKKTGFADEIIIEESVGQKFRDIQKYNIDIFTVGSDWIGVFDHFKDYCEVVYLERTKNISSTMLREKNQKINRLGIIGTGRIAFRFMNEAKSVSGCSVNLVYNPRLASAKKFGDNHNVDYTDDLDKFFSLVDSVYIASPHQTHYDYIKQALNNGKNVLCEKPMVLSKSEAEEVFNLAKEKGLVLFEGIKTAYCPGFNHLLGVACSGVIGKICAVEATFTKLEKTTNRELADTEFGGSFLELGSYTLLPAIKLLGTDFKDIRFETLKAENGVDIYTKAYIKYNNALAEATCGLGVKSSGQLIISGTKGYIVVEAPWWKTTFFEIHYEEYWRVDKYADRFVGEGLRYELSEFISAINGADKHSFKLTKEDSIAIAEIIEKFRKENEICNEE